MRIGTIVRVPLHGRRVRGWVLDADVAAPEVEGARLRDVLAVVSAGPPPDVVDLCRWAAWRWAGPLATFLRAASAANVVRADVEPELETAVYPPSLETDAGPLVIVPPTGEHGAIASQLVAPEGSSIVIDPDAARAASLVTTFENQGREVLSLRSDRSAAELSAAWDRARAGACVVVGGRTAVWAPVPDLTRIVVVDEADEALEDERAPTWNARDVAIERARRAGASVRVVTPAPTIDVVVALDEEPRPGHARAVATRHGGRHARRAARAGAAHGRARRRAPPGARCRRPIGVRPEPQGPGPAARVPHLQRARALRAVRRDGAGRRSGPHVLALRHGPAADLSALPRNPLPGRPSRGDPRA